MSEQKADLPAGRLFAAFPGINLKRCHFYKDDRFEDAS
jgi:hypothetical protein